MWENKRVQEKVIIQPEWIQIWLYSGYGKPIHWWISNKSAFYFPIYPYFEYRIVESEANRP